MSGRGSSDSNIGCGFLLGVFFLIAVVPKPVWIFLGVVVGAAAVGGIVYLIGTAVDNHRAAQAAHVQREREERARMEKQRRIDTFGKRNAALVEFALSAVRQVATSEAASAGWLGDVDFSADIEGISDNFEKAHALRNVTSKLSALDKLGADDRKILAEAKTTIASLEGAAIERVELIGKCAKEAQLIDQSLHAERDDARVAERRAELHAKLSAMLYGIEAAPGAAPADSAVDAVMARVQAYREIKNQIQQARDCGPG